MNTIDDARYRLTLAEGQLADAERDFGDRRWHLCIASAQSAAENAGKAVISCFLPVEKTHEPVKQIESMLNKGVIPVDVQVVVEDMLPALRNLGRTLHVQATYGDEDSHTPPWDLFDMEKTHVALQHARRAVAAAQRVCRMILDIDIDDEMLPNTDD